MALHHYVSSILPYPDVFGFLVILPSVFLPSCLLTSLSLNLRALTPLQALSPAIFHVTCFYSFPSVSHFFLSLLLRPFLFLSHIFFLFTISSSTLSSLHSLATPFSSASFPTSSVSVFLLALSPLHLLSFFHSTASILLMSPPSANPSPPPSSPTPSQYLSALSVVSFPLSSSSFPLPPHCPFLVGFVDCRRNS